jgi:hypothetical protein
VLAAALSGSAYAVAARSTDRGGAAPAVRERVAASKIGLWLNRDTFTVGTGDVGTQIVRCASPHPALAISGGYQVVSGNFVSIVTATLTGDSKGYAVTAVVPNAIDSPGVLPARIRIKVLCIEKDNVVFGEIRGA